MSSRIAIFTCLPLLLVDASAGFAADTQLEAVFARFPTAPTENVCLVRHYSAGDLAAHPKQNVNDLLVYVGKRQGVHDGYIYYNVNAQLRFRDSKQNFTFSADCGRQAGEIAPIGCGIDCEGGGLNVALNADKTVALTITSSIRLNASDSASPQDTAGFKSEDVRFVLRQTSLGECIPVIHDEALKAGLMRGAITQ